MLLRLVQNAIRTGLATEVDDIIPMINDPDLRGRAKLEVLRFRLASMASMQKEVDDMGMLDMVDKGALDFGLAHELIARHNARLGGPGFRKTVEGWQTDKLRALGNIGIALGLQDRATKEKP